MTPTLFVARITGPRATHLSLHTSYEGAVNAVLRAGGALHRNRFGYAPEDLRPLTQRAAEYGQTAAAALRLAEDRLFGAAGWIAKVEELPVELDSAEEDAHRERIAEDRDGERAGQPY